MEREKVFLSLAALLIGFFLISSSFFCLFIYKDFLLKEQVISFFCSHTLAVALVMGGLGAFLLVAFSYMNKAHALHLKMGHNAFLEIKEKVIKDCLCKKIDFLFPKQRTLTTVKVRSKKKLEIFLTLPFLSLEEKVLKNMEKLLETTLEKQFGFKGEFFVHVCFQKGICSL